jgi:hypothetical protein
MTQISSDETDGAHWLPDNRRVVYFAGRGTVLVIVDSVTRQRTVVPVPLPAPATDDVFTVSRDGRTIYYGAQRVEADIWIAERK